MYYNLLYVREVTDVWLYDFRKSIKKVKVDNKIILYRYEWTFSFLLEHYRIRAIILCTKYIKYNCSDKKL